MKWLLLKPYIFRDSVRYHGIEGAGLGLGLLLRDITASQFAARDPDEGPAEGEPDHFNNMQLSFELIPDILQACEEITREVAEAVEKEVGSNPETGASKRKDPPVAEKDALQHPEPALKKPKATPAYRAATKDAVPDKSSRKRPLLGPDDTQLDEPLAKKSKATGDVDDPTTPTGDQVQEPEHPAEEIAAEPGAVEIRRSARPRKQKEQEPDKKKKSGTRKKVEKKEKSAPVEPAAATAGAKGEKGQAGNGGKGGKGAKGGRKGKEKETTEEAPAARSTDTDPPEVVGRPSRKRNAPKPFEL